MTTLNYKTLKLMSKANKGRINDLLALSPQNDPFYTGAPATEEMARWFTELWQQFRYANGIHLRRIHYQAISQDPPIICPNGKPYENTDNDWAFLVMAAKHARYLGMVDPEAFIDRRNPDPIIYTNWNNGANPDPVILVSNDWNAYDYELPDLPNLGNLPDRLPDLPTISAEGYENIQQDYHIEVWAEKSTMNDILIPICKKYGINLITGMGEMSITAVINLLKRAAQSERPTRILYISDFDPAGMGMPISVARKIEFYQRTNGVGELNICLQPVVLTLEQVRSYKLPRTPIKETELRRGHFESAYGTGAVELDALEALYPGELANIVSNEILRYYDPELVMRSFEMRDRLQDHLHDKWHAIRDEHNNDLRAMEDDYKDLLDDFENTRQEFSALIEPFKPKLEAYRGRLAEIMGRAKVVYNQFEEDLENSNIDVDNYPLPEAETVGDPEGVLYDSDRDYFAQLEIYKARRAGKT
jgi:hypothetical protein